MSLANPQALPDTLTITLDRDDTVGTVCRVAWRDREQVGLAFVSNADRIRDLIKQSAHLER